MVLLVLAIVWGVLLVSWLRSRTQNTLSDSVGTFRRHLSVLERATPGTVMPANRLRSDIGYGIPAYRPPARAIRGQLVTPVAGVARVGPAPVAARRVSPAVSARRRHAQKRRRDIFFALVAAVIGSLLLAMIPGLSIMWSVQVVFDVVLVAYVALLVRLRNLAAERELKLTFMPPPRRAPQPRYEFGGSGYGELGFRRAAN